MEKHLLASHNICLVKNITIHNSLEENTQTEAHILSLATE